MLRSLFLAAAIAAAPWRLSAAPCGVSGSIVNGFESAAGCPEGADLPNWTTAFTGGVTASGTLTSGNFANTGVNPQEGSTIGTLDWTQSSFVNGAVKVAGISLPAASFPAAVGSNWAAQNYLYFQYSTTYTAYGSYAIITPSAGAVMTWNPGNGKNISTGAWTTLVMSFNYARNLGDSMTNISALQLQQKTATNPGSWATTYFDDLAVTNTAQDTPNPAVLSYTVTANYPGGLPCGNISITWTAAAATGSDPITGYHIYRSTNGVAGPWTSFRYVTNTTGFIDNSPAVGNPNQSYIVLPYSCVTSRFGSGSGFFMYLLGDSGSPTLGVNEALLDPANQASAPFTSLGACPASPTPTFSVTLSDTPTNTPSLTSTPTFTASPTLTKTFTPSPTAPGTFTNTPVVTATNTPLPTNTWTESATPGGPTNTWTVTNTWTPTFTVTPTFTATNTQVIVKGGPQIFPNPFHPDQGEVFHLGNVPVGNEIYIYNMIGQFVRKFTITSSTNSWDGLNANGVRVVTGIYFVVIQNKIYRVAVVRGS
jgi:hypothetical protein